MEDRDIRRAILIKDGTVYKKIKASTFFIKNLLLPSYFITTKQILLLK